MCQPQVNAATKVRKTIAITPFIVKNAAFNRRRSLGRNKSGAHTAAAKRHHHDPYSAGNANDPEREKPAPTIPSKADSRQGASTRAIQKAASTPTACGML